MSKNKQASAKKRAQKELLLNPNKYRDLGAIGGRVKTPKGLAKLTLTRRREIARLAVIARAEKGLVSTEIGNEAALKALNDGVAGLLN